MDDSPWMTIKEAAAYAKMPVKVICTFIRKEQLIAYGTPKRRRIHRQHLDEQMIKGFPKVGAKPVLPRRRRGEHVTRLV